MTYTRLLTIDDAPYVVEIVTSRNSYVHTDPMNHQELIKQFTNPNTYDKNHFNEIFGLFEDDGTLDCFRTFHYPTRLSPRADDPSKKEKAIIMGIVFSLNKPDRKKYNNGMDYNFVRLHTDYVKYFHQQKYFTRWSWSRTTTPKLVYFKNEDHIKEIGYKYINTLIPLAANTIVTDGPYHEFINKFVIFKPWPFDINVHVFSLKSEYR